MELKDGLELLKLRTYLSVLSRTPDLMHSYYEPAQQYEVK